MNSVVDDLQIVFPEYKSDAQLPNWEAAKVQVPVGSKVRGVVIGRYPFGVFVDTGVGFPALLLVTHFKVADEHPCTSIETYPPAGTIVNATVSGYADNVRQIGMSQLPCSSRK